MIAASRPALLALEDGTVFRGRSVSPGTRFGEVKVRRDPACPVCGEQADRPDTGEGDEGEPRLRSVG